ncbi:DUF2304 domain-containing protein [Eubacterium sp. MSJ-33]|uniref:DUF2304 domain-containing protein n=1 Tax=Eubacterium sp. MSJ-33 TaxID=2841528 RepID=UPI001C758173|nr:DUF2304 domain-containing protein [Eubacterium sp. MSJ-33]QWT52068.1 DUF2304 domain-containing protein [Eubacterium sp. MSJ-33]
MMTTVFRIILLVCVLVYLLVILALMRRGRMSLKYSLIWFLSGVILLICVIFPQVIRFFTRLMGIYSDTNAVFFIGVCFLILIVLSLTSIASGQSERIRTLVQTQAILEKRVRDLEEKVGRMENEK